MPVTMSMNKTSPPRSPTYMHPSKSMYKPPSPDPAEVLAAAKANELLNLRSANISYILAQRSEAGKEFANKTAIKLPEANPRIDELHTELGIDKVVLVKCPFEIDTTPGGQWHNPLLTQSVEGGGTGKLRDSWMPGFREKQNEGPVRADAVEWSANGNAASACVNGRLLRGGWAVQ